MKILGKVIVGTVKGMGELDVFAVAPAPGSVQA
jgi:hypothetical protein